MVKQEWLKFIHQLVEETLPNSDSILPVIDKSFNDCLYPSVFLYKLSKGIELVRKKNTIQEISNPAEFIVSIIRNQELSSLRA